MEYVEYLGVLVYYLRWSFSIMWERIVGYKLSFFEVLRMISWGKFDFKYFYVFLLWYNWNILW